MGTSEGSVWWEEGKMWYVIQVAGGQEEETAALIQKQIPHEILTECFIPRKERVKKFHGCWQQVEEILFPGYVFSVTAQPEELFLRLKRVSRLTKLLKDGESFFIPLSEKEEEFIRSIGDNYHITRLSRLLIRETQEMGRGGGNANRNSTSGAGLCFDNLVGKEVVILSGPLKNHPGRIRSCNLHKREVTVALPFMGRETEVRMGIEIVGEKTE